MIWLYRLLYLPGLLVALPYYLLRMWRRGGYGKDFQHRLGLFRCLSAPAENKTRIWLQAVSVGEVMAVGPLIDALHVSGKVEIVLTTTTSTGYEMARRHYADKVHSIGIFPLDFWLFSRLAWKRIQPDCVILTESELWPEHLHRAKERDVPAYLVNARMSDKSYSRYQKVSGFAQRLFGKLKAIFAASDLDLDRIGKMTPQSTATHSTGSVKLDVPLPEQLDEVAIAGLRRELGLVCDTNQSLILLGSSTWPGEESALIEIVTELRAEGMDLRLVLVPRHAERGPELERLLQQQDLPWHRRSTGKPVSGPVVIYLADTTGELEQLSQLADIAFIGKSLGPNNGGQSPIVAAGLGIPLLFGPNMTNFKAIAKTLTIQGAAHEVLDAQELNAIVSSLLKSPRERDAMSAAGQAWHERNRGSSQRIADHILEDLGLISQGTKGG